MKRGPYRTKDEPGSWAALIRDFRQSPKYKGWAPGTRRHADRVMDDFRAHNAREQVSSLTFGDIVLMRDSLSDTPGAANNWLKVMGHLLKYARRVGYIETNPLSDGLERLPPNRPGGFRTWRDDEISAYRDRWSVGSLARLTFELALGTAAAPVDLVRLGRANVSDGRIAYRRQKTERRKGAEETPMVDIPILPGLAEVLAHVPSDKMTFLETEQGLPRSQGALVHAFRRWVAEAGLGAPDKYGRHLTPHGLRKARGRLLAEAGASPFVVMAWLGQESIKAAEIYTRMVDRTKAADMGAELLGGAKPSNVTRMRKAERSE